MRERLLQYIRCVDCESSLQPEVFKSVEGRIESGLLHSPCGAWYPIVNSVPRLLPPDLLDELVLTRAGDFFDAHQARLTDVARERWAAALENRKRANSLKVSTAESFGFEWQKFHKLFDAYRLSFLDYVQPFREADFRDQIVLDAGCGVGRHAYWAAKFGARDVIGFDVSEAVEPAARNCRELPNVHIVQADIYHPPFPRCFTFVMSIGVIHHLPDPEDGFRHLVSLVAPGGTILIWVYGRRSNRLALHLYEPMRTLTRRLPKKVVLQLSHLFAVIAEGFNRLSNGLERFGPTRRLGRVLPFQYYRHFPYAVKHNDAFDILATPKSRYYHLETVRAWFDRAKLRNPDLRYLRAKSIIASAKIPPA